MSTAETLPVPCSWPDCECGVSIPICPQDRREARNRPSSHIRSPVEVEILDRLRDARVCVVGDVLLDRWVYGRVERISPEAPVPVFVQERVEERPGGAGNVAANIAALGATVSLVGDWLVKPIKERFIVGRQQIFRRDVEEIDPIGANDELGAFNEVARNTVGCLILSDYGKGMLTPGLCQRLIGWAREHGVPVVVDPKGEDWSKYHGATVVTPNEAEWGPVEVDCLDGLTTVLLTRGASGMSVIYADHDPLDIPARRREVFDVTGAGDTVVAVLGACLSVGIVLEEAARIANAAAGVVVGKPGTAVCTMDELREELAR